MFARWNRTVSPGVTAYVPFCLSQINAAFISGDKKEQTIRNRLNSVGVFGRHELRYKNLHGLIILLSAKLDDNKPNLTLKQLLHDRIYKAYQDR